MTVAEQLRTLVEALDEPGLLLDGTRVLVANSAAKDLMGAGLEGRDVRLALRHPAIVEHVLARRQGDVPVSGIGGVERPWTATIRPAGTGLLLVRLVDRSAEVAAERMRVDFVANASHELRTPLSTIIGYAETLADDGDLDPATHARFAAIIRSEAIRMLRIVQDLMSLSRIEADRFVAPRDRILPEELVRSAAASVQSLADERACRIVVEVAPDLPLIRGDRGQLLQVLDNLLANGLRYGCRERGCTVRLAARVRGRNLLLVIADTGEGISREHLPRLTERFYRVDAARSRDSGGTGLGLAIVKHIVERHRGSLQIRSVPGKGTEVTVSLPVG